MSILFLLVPLALFFAVGFTAAFVWCVQCGQYDDLETPAYRLLLEDKHDSSEK